MFQSLETTWDRSARRSWSTIASFTMQALALSLLLAIPLIWMEVPPPLHWLDENVLSPPPARLAAAPMAPQHALRTTEMLGVHLLQATRIPTNIPIIGDDDSSEAPPIRDGVPWGTDSAGRPGVLQSIGNATALAPTPSKPAALKTPRISQWAEGGLVYRVQPAYPTLARQARIQGAVQLRAIISKTGTIENLNVLNGAPMLVAAAIDAVKRWRYRPYMLNGEPIEVETDITVNFILAN